MIPVTKDPTHKWYVPTLKRCRVTRHFDPISSTSALAIGVLSRLIMSHLSARVKLRY